ncbi:MAG: peptide chain release factor-like protein [Actinomycetota bacterium]
MRLTDGRHLPVERATMHATTGSGPGGQHRNRSQTRVELRLPLALMGLTEAELERVRGVLRHRIVDDALVVRAGEQRSQHQNRVAAEERMVRLVDGALRRDPRRVATRPTRASQTRRLEEKQRQARRKAERRVPFDD